MSNQYRSHPSDVVNNLTSFAVPGERSAEVDAFEAETVAFSLEAAELIGIPKSLAAMHEVVFAWIQPLSFSEIELRLNLFEGSIGQRRRMPKKIAALCIAESAGTIFESHSTSRAQGCITSKAEPKLRDPFDSDLPLRKAISSRIERRLQSASTRTTPDQKFGQDGIEIFAASRTSAWE